VRLTVKPAGATYYLSSIDGDDARTPTQAQDPATPWKTLAKLTAVFPDLQPGDSILLERGETFPGALVIGRSGTAASPIFISAYGSGSDPIVSGFKTVAAWTDLGGNVWESTAPVSTLASCNVVRIGGVDTAMGRYPNTGYLTYESFSGNTSITSASITASPDWTGAEAVIKKERWIIDRGRITSHSGSTLGYAGGGYDGHAGWGFFIQNDRRTLDQPNEWYFDPTSGKIAVYSVGAPVGVEVAAVDDLVTMIYRDHLIIDGLSFEGANRSALDIGSSSDVTVRSCTMEACFNGVLGEQYGASSDGFTLEGCTVAHSNNNGIDLPPEVVGARLLHNRVTQSGMLVGMSGSGDGKAQGMNVSSNGALIESNEVDDSGYIGIGFEGDGSVVTHNLVNGFCSVKDDGGGIYTGNEHPGARIIANTVINGLGDGAGTSGPGTTRSFGIYLDGDVSSGFEVRGNALGSTGYGGVFLHNSHDVIVADNTSFDATYGLLVKDDVSSSYLTNLEISGNAWCARSAGQAAMQISTLHDDVASLGTLDHNIYARPVDDDQLIEIAPEGEGQASTTYSLAGWQAAFGHDAQSQGSARAASSDADLRFEYNATALPRTVMLDASYVDLAGTAHAGSLELAPYASVVLIKSP
jgi:parallel beta-helix repeat protein